jgi:hypothetical protein
MRGWKIVTLSLALIAAPGCGQKKIAECKMLVDQVNDAVAGLEKAPKNEADPSGVSDLKAMAESMDKIAGDAQRLQLTLPELKKLRDDYQKMARDIAKAERELATAAQEQGSASDPDKRAQALARRTAAESTLDAAVKQEDPLVDQINKFCQER